MVEGAEDSERAGVGEAEAQVSRLPTDVEERITTYTPMLWVSMSDDERYGEYIRVKQKVLALEALGRPLVALAADYKTLYFELLYQVGMKHPNETRHETALRYLRQAETGAGQQACSSSPIEAARSAAAEEE